MASKERYALTAKCTKCTFQVTQEVYTEPENLSTVKTEMLKQVVMIHPKHADLANFIIY
jgi:hypothetical protein